MERNYQGAVAALNTLQTNFAVLDAIRKSGGDIYKQAIPEMVEWCRKAGYEPADFDRLNPIHIAGTKGKGSTSAFISSILLQYLPREKPRLRKIGLFTSPHLRSVRERIRLNDAPLSEDDFTRHFFTVWDRLEESARKAGLPTDISAKPMYFRFLTIMALHAYLGEGVDTAVIETGIGGEYDSTNVLVHPTVVGITSLGLDHQPVLGNTIEEIAWHKAGIMKAGTPAFTVPQPDDAMQVLRRRAAEKGVTLTVVERHPDMEHIKLGLAADFQKTNASLAVAVAAAHLRRLGFDDVPEDIAGSVPLPDRFRRGLEEVRFEGRCEIRREEGISWFIDGGHTMESIALAGRWYADEVLKRRGTQRRALIFNQQTRDATALAGALRKTLTDALADDRPFSHVVFCSNQTFRQTGYKADLISLNVEDGAVALKVQRGLEGAWKEMEGVDGPRKTDVQVQRTIEDAVQYLRGLRTDDGKEDDLMVLVTGSLHLVGGFLEVLEETRGREREG